MNKKKYIKPTARMVFISNESLLAGSGDPNVTTASYEGNDSGSGEAEAKGNWAWDD